MKHYAIEGRHLSMKDKWMQQLLKGEGELETLAGKKGLLFSTLTLEKMIEEEERHEKVYVDHDKTRSLRSYSSGEQRKALLAYLIQQKPDFLVLDNPFDCLDVQSVLDLKQRCTEISQQISLVQIFKRQEDILPIIDKVVFIENEAVHQVFSLNEFKEQHLHAEKADENYQIPPPLKAVSNVPEILVELNDVNVSYDGRGIVKNINWQVKSGEFWHLKGPNGSGKTTLLSMIYGDNPKAFGEDIVLFGNKKGSGESVWEIKEKIGYFTPSLTQLFHSSDTLEQMVISGLVDSVGLYLKPTDRQKNLARQWLKVIQFEDKKDASFYHQSQICQRLVLIARAMIKHPPLLILDEPSTGLDDYSASLMVNLIQKIAKESTTAIIYVSHRTEKGLKPNYTFELVKEEDGSKGLCY